MIHFTHFFRAGWGREWETSMNAERLLVVLKIWSRMPFTALTILDHIYFPVALVAKCRHGLKACSM